MSVTVPFNKETVKADEKNKTQDQGRSVWQDLLITLLPLPMEIPSTSFTLHVLAVIIAQTRLISLQPLILRPSPEHHLLAEEIQLADADSAVIATAAREPVLGPEEPGAEGEDGDDAEGDGGVVEGG